MFCRLAAAFVFLVSFNSIAADVPELTAAEKEKVAALIAKLGNEDFDARKSATLELRKYDARIRPLLQAALEKAGDVETANSLKVLIGRFEARDKLKALAAKFDYNPDRIMSEASAGFAKPTRETQILFRLAAALFRRNAEKDKEGPGQRIAETRVRACDNMAMVAVQTGRLPADVDDVEIKRTVDEFVAELPKDQEKK